MCNVGDGRSDEQGWRQVRDYCQRFGREHLLRPYLYDRANHGEFSVPTFPQSFTSPNKSTSDYQIATLPSPKQTALTYKTDYATIGTTSELRTQKMEGERLSDERRSKSNEDINSNPDVSIKGGSPDSGITSRKLEWDSLADIGYENLNLGDSQNRNTFSTIERIVLDRNFKIDITSNRSDKSNTRREMNFSTSPKAHSTPTSNLNSSKSSNKNANTTTRNTIKNSGSREYKNFKSVTVNLKINKPEKSDRSNKSSANSSKKIIETSDQRLDETTQTSNVRSEHKEVQTSVKKNRKPVYIIKRKIPKVSIGKIQYTQNKDDYDLDIVIDQSLNSHRSPETNIQSPEEVTTFLKSDDNILMSADSFEFVPGHAYQISPSTECENTKSPSYRKSDTSSADFNDPVHSSSSRLIDKETSMQSSVKLNSDSSVELIDKLISRHCTLPELKSKLSEKIVKILKNDSPEIKKIDEQSQTELQSQARSSNDNKSVYSSAKSVKSQIKSDRNESPKSIGKTSVHSDKSTTGTELDKQLNKINAKIASLLVMKVKLENKQNESKKSTDSLSSSAVTITNERNVDIPLLNLKSSSEDNSEFEKEISERKVPKIKSKEFKEPMPNTETYTKNDKLTSKTESSNCTCNSNNMCSFCVLNRPESSSVSSDISKTKSDLAKIEKFCSTFKRCKAMKSFLKDYAEIAKMYHKVRAHKKEIVMHSEKPKELSNSEDSTMSKVPETDKIPSDKSRENKPSDRSSEIKSKSREPSAETSKKSDVKPINIKDSQMLLKEICEAVKGLDEKLNAMHRTPPVKIDHATQIPSYESTVRTSQIESNKEYHKSKSDLDSQLNIDSSQKSCYSKSSRAESYKSKRSIKCHCKGSSSKMHPFEVMINNTREKDIKKPLAYNLVLEPSDSVLYESLQSRRKSLDKMVVKVPKLQPKNVHRALRTPNLDSNRGDSTDDQLKELSSLNSAKSDCGSKSAGYEVPADDKDKILTVKEYLYQNRLSFVHKADRRRSFILESQRLRSEQEEEIKKRLENGVANMSISELKRLIKMRSKTRSLSRNKRLFDSQEIKRNTERQYKHLPEIVNKNEKLKKESYRKSNRLMAEIFVKKLQQRTLKGVVNNSLCTNVLTL